MTAYRNDGLGVLVPIKDGQHIPRRDDIAPTVPCDFDRMYSEIKLRETLGRRGHRRVELEQMNLEQLTQASRA